MALKALLPQLSTDPTVVQRFLAEARALAQLRHPNIVTVYDVGQADGRPFFTMELIEGETLARLATPGQGLPLERVLPLLRGTAAALDALHAARLVHRDVKASNIMQDRSGRVVLMDLGIARALDQEQQTLSGISLGTPEAMAPEQVRGLPVGPAADIYALGILAYRLLAGRAPFVGDTAAVMHAHAYEPPPPLRELRADLPEPVYAAIDAALAKEPAQRPASAVAFVDALEGDQTLSTTLRLTAQALTQPFAPAAVPPPGSSRRGRRAAILGLAAVLAVAAAVAVVFAMRGGGSGRAAGGNQASPTASAVALAVSRSPSPPPSASPTPAASSTPVATASATPAPSSTAGTVRPPASATQAPRPSVTATRAPTITATSTSSGGTTIAALGDDPKCCLVRVEQIQPVNEHGRGVQLHLGFDIHGGIGWSGDNNPAYAQDVYLIDEQGRRYPLAEPVSGPSAVDNPSATTIDGFYRFGPLATDARFVWLHYGTDRAHSRAVILGFYLGAAAPEPTITPRSQFVNSGGTDTGCCRVTLVRAEGQPDDSIRLYLAFNVFATGGWKGDSRPENAATIYLVDDQNRRLNLQRVIGPSANDDATAVTTGGWYVFGPLSPGAKRAHLQYGDAAVDFTLGAAAPP